MAKKEKEEEEYFTEVPMKEDFSCKMHRSGTRVSVVRVKPSLLGFISCCK